MELIRASWLLFRLHLGSVGRSRRTLIAFVLAVIPPLLAFAVMRFGPDNARADEVVGGMAVFFSVNFIVPVLSLVMGSAVVNEEVENRTITYIFTRPVPRVALLLGRWAATLVLVGGLLIVSSGGVLMAATTTGEALPDGLGLHYVWATLLGGAVYTLMFAVLGVFLRNPMVVGLGYVFAIEGLLANLPGSTGSLSVQYFLRSILASIDLPIWKSLEGMNVEYVSSTEATVRMGILILVALIVGTWGISRKQYVLTS